VLNMAIGDVFNSENGKIGEEPVERGFGLNQDQNNFDFGTAAEIGTSVGLDLTKGQQQQEGLGRSQVGFQGLGNSLQRSDILGLNFKGFSKAPVPVQLLFSPAATINNLLKRREKRFQKEVDGYNNELNSLYARQQKQDEQFMTDMHDASLKRYDLAEDQNSFMNNFYNAARHIRKANENNQNFISKKSQQITDSENKSVQDLNKIRRQGLQ